ncbi:MAG: hypothetical protein QOE62_929, partial [Actinomycetota bacterium]|nr:hypothetical protein [Actinomycetota bacterium]
SQQCRPCRNDRNTTHFTVVAWSLRHIPWGDSWDGGPEHVVVTYTDVASDQRAAAEAAYLSVVLPELAEWLIRAVAAPEGWRVLDEVPDTGPLRQQVVHETVRDPVTGTAEVRGQSYSSEPCTQRNDWMSIMSRGRSSRRS